MPAQLHAGLSAALDAPQGSASGDGGENLHPVIVTEHFVTGEQGLAPDYNVRFRVQVQLFQKLLDSAAALKLEFSPDWISNDNVHDSEG